MKLSPEEKAAQKAAFRAMSPSKKLEHIFIYYKWPILLGLLALAILGATLQRELTKKEPALYLGLVNVVVGEELEEELSDGFLLDTGADPRRQEVYLYRDLYLSDQADTLNHQYAYASRMKLMGAVNAGELDLVLMNREAYDLLSRSGYLLELSPALFSDEPGLYERLLPMLMTNEVVLSDNSIEFQLGEAETHQVETQAVRNALQVSGLPLFTQAGFSEPVYLGLIANSQRLPACLQYIGYLLSGS